MECCALIVLKLVPVCGDLFFFFFLSSGLELSLYFFVPVIDSFAVICQGHHLDIWQ